jgi:oligopeptide/dipeptide ABC transporter ATP-binding protein
VGESGSGKSATSLALVRLLPDNAILRGSVTLRGEELSALSEQALANVRGRRIGVVFQDPARALNPVLSIGKQVREILQRHLGLSHAAADERAEALLREVGINDARARLEQYPHELSGGLKQRVMIAIALACEPELLIADEPTTALDVTIQRQVLLLLRRLCSERQLALMLITHDFGVVAAMADRVAVMYAGRIVEQADAAALFAAPRHPYTRGLLAANPRQVLEAEGEVTLQPIPGSPPDPLLTFTGCAFAARCSLRIEQCATLPPLAEVSPGHAAACWRAEEPAA